MWIICVLELACFGEIIVFGSRFSKRTFEEKYISSLTILIKLALCYTDLYT